MRWFRRLFLRWYKEDEDRVKEVRTENAILKAQKAESSIRKLAEIYRAEGLVVKKVRASSIRQ